MKRKFEVLQVNDIQNDEGQPRKTFDEEKLDELAKSIKEIGLIQPIEVDKNNKLITKIKKKTFLSILRCQTWCRTFLCLTIEFSQKQQQDDDRQAATDKNILAHQVYGAVDIAGFIINLLKLQPPVF